MRTFDEWLKTASWDDWGSAAYFCKPAWDAAMAEAMPVIEELQAELKRLRPKHAGQEVDDFYRDDVKDGEK